MGFQIFRGSVLADACDCENVGVQRFCNKNNRRGLIFDKPALENEEGGPACDCNPSSSSFGHSGFTGSLAWVDPSENFVYVFLSNRVHPTSENNKLLEMDVRTKIMDVFYKSIRQ